MVEVVAAVVVQQGRKVQIALRLMSKFKGMVQVVMALLQMLVFLVRLL